MSKRTPWHGFVAVLLVLAFTCFSSVADDDDYEVGTSAVPLPAGRPQNNPPPPPPPPKPKPKPPAPKPQVSDRLILVPHAVQAEKTAGDLLYYQYLGIGDGSASWGKTGIKVGNGWNFKQVFSGGNGVLFAVNDAGELFYYQYLGMRDGSSSWGAASANKIGNGWNFKQVFSGGDGVIFARP